MCARFEPVPTDFPVAPAADRPAVKAGDRVRFEPEHVKHLSVGDRFVVVSTAATVGAGWLIEDELRSGLHGAIEQVDTSDSSYYVCFDDPAPSAGQKLWLKFSDVEPEPEPQTPKGPPIFKLKFGDRVQVVGHHDGKTRVSLYFQEKGTDGHEFIAVLSEKQWDKVAEAVDDYFLQQHLARLHG